ncbi:MAG: DUF6268 family outer membrane beta-barrel protein [Planctomycetota bacterium]|nr:DUF6268 family outer membrane beta-barrel protein [Planctomycetota bacterium]
MAQSTGADAPLRGARPADMTAPVVTIDADSRLAFRADVQGTDADVLVNHSGLGVTVSGALSESFRLTFGVDGELSYYDFGDGRSIMPGGDEPFEDLYSAGMTLVGTWTFSEPWSLTTGGFLRGAGESDVDVGDAIFGGGFAALGYSFTEKSRIAFGVGVSSQLEDEPRFFPYIATRMQLTEALRLESRGLGIAVISTINEQWEAGLKISYENRQFRLNDDRDAWRNGVMRDARVPVGVEVTWRPVQAFSLVMEAGAIVYQEFEFLNERGVKIEDFETEPAPFIGVRLEYRF